jgi:2-(1,2-epoxy-1,2-dihydrophenyl)acetyl-CoA isomerase
MTVAISVDSGVAHLRLNRPEALNAINADLLRAFDRCLSEALRDRPRALVLSGEGRAFCAGGDIDFGRSLVENLEESAPLYEEVLATTNRIVSTIDAAGCITIAALEGAVVGAGIGFALATDLRVMGRSARLIPGWVKVAASADAGGSYFLAQHLGPRAMRAFLLRGQPMNAQRAFELLVADEVVADGRATTRALELADELGNLSTSSITSVRRLASEASTHDLAAHLELESQLAREIRMSGERRSALSNWRPNVRAGP